MKIQDGGLKFVLTSTSQRPPFACNYQASVLLYLNFNHFERRKQYIILTINKLAIISFGYFNKLTHLSFRVFELIIKKKAFNCIALLKLYN